MARLALARPAARYEHAAARHPALRRATTPPEDAAPPPSRPALSVAMEKASRDTHVHGYGRRA